MKAIRNIFLLILTAIAVWLILLFPGLAKKKKMAKLTKHRYAHRGFHDKENGIPENSMAAFKRAVDNGFGIELDVHLSKDNRLVVVHDDNFIRTTGKNLLVENATSANIDELYLEGTKEEVPYLEKVLKLVDGRVPLLIELKPANGRHEALCRYVFKLLDKYRGAYCIESFDPRIIMWINKHKPHVLKGQLAGKLNAHGAGVSFGVDFVIKNLILNFFSRPDFISYNYEDRDALSLKIVKHLYGEVIFYWTIKNKEDAIEAEDEDAVIIFEQFDPR